MIAGFSYGTHSADGVDVAYCTGGSGSPLLLLHGFPQTHMMWAQIAPKLAQNFTVICADLRGYGASGKPNGTENYSFRAMGQDQLSLMSALGFTRFHLAGHDRGGRVAHRIALDAPQRITSLTVMDIVPTHHLLDELHQSVAKAYYHWFFLAQPAPFPETLIAADPDYFYQSCLLGWGAAKLEQFPANQLQAYRLAWRNPETMRGMCEDYRAALIYDFDVDAMDLDRKLTCPALVLSGADGVMDQMFDMQSVWASRLEDMRHIAVRGGHFFVDQNPDETLTHLKGFLNTKP